MEGLSKRWGPSSGPGGSHNRTTVCLVETDKISSVTPICGFRSLDPIRAESQQECQVPEFCFAGGRKLLEQDDASHRVMRSACIMLDIMLECTSTVGKQHGKVGESLWQLLAPGGGSREQSQERTLKQDPGHSEDEDGQRRAPTSRVEGGRALGDHMEDGVGGQLLLAGSSAHPGVGMASSRFEGPAVDTGGRSGELWFERGVRGIASRGVVQRVEGGFTKQGEEQGQEGSKKEKTEARKRGASIIQRTEVGKRWRSWQRRKQVIRWRSGGVLRLEQRQWRLRWITSRRAVSGKEASPASMHSMQIARSSLERLPKEECINYRIPFSFCTMAGSGGKRGRDGGEDDQRKKDEDRHGERMEKKTKVRRWTKRGDDQADGERVMIGGRLVNEEEYKVARTFVFLHHFAGEKDGLKMALEEEAERRKMKVKVFSVERKTGSDLLATEPYQSNMKELKAGNIDGYHSLKQETGDTFQRGKCRRWWTLSIACPTSRRSSSTLAGFRRVYHRARGLRNPRCLGGHSRVWQNWRECATAAHHMLRWWEGRDPGPQGEYPKELCDVYAEAALDYFEKMAKAEFLDAKATVVQRKIEEMKKKTTAIRKEIGSMAPPSPMTPPTTAAPSSPRGAPRKRRKDEEEEGGVAECGGGQASSSYSWKAGQGKHGAVRESRAKAALPKNVAFVGGMRHPQRAVEQLPTVQALGLKVGGVWERFSRENPKVLETAETYGTKEVKIHHDLVEKWGAELRKLL